MVILLTLASGSAMMGCRDRSADIPTSAPANATSASRPAEPPADVIAPPTAPAPPHQGRLEAIPRGVGWVEWVQTAGEPEAKVYFLDASGAPLPGVGDPAITLSTSAGPVAATVQSCPQTPVDPSCRSVYSPHLAEAVVDGVIRFTLNGEPCRVLIPARPAESAPSTARAPMTREVP